MKRAADPQTVAKYFKIAKRLQWNRRQQQLIQLSNTTRRRRKGDQCEDVAQSHFYLTASASEFPQPQRAWWQPWSPQAPTAGQQSSLQKLGAQRKLRHRNGEWEVMQSQARRESDRNRWVSEWVRKIKMETTTRNDGNALRFQGKPATAAATAVCQSHAQSVNQSINQSIERSINNRP